MSGNTRSHYPKAFTRSTRLAPTELFMPTLTVERPVVSFNDVDIDYLRRIHRVVGRTLKQLPSYEREGHRIIRPTDFRMVQVQHTITSSKLAKKFTRTPDKQMAKVAHVFKGNASKVLEDVPSMLVLRIGNLSLRNPNLSDEHEATLESEIYAEPLGWDSESRAFNPNGPFAQAITQLEGEGLVHTSSMAKIDPSFRHGVHPPTTALITRVGSIQEAVFDELKHNLANENIVPLTGVALDPVLCLRVANRRQPLAEVSLRV